MTCIVAAGIKLREVSVSSSIIMLFRRLKVEKQGFLCRQIICKLSFPCNRAILGFAHKKSASQGVFKCHFITKNFGTLDRVQAPPPLVKCRSQGLKLFVNSGKRPSQSYLIVGAWLLAVRKRCQPVPDQGLDFSHHHAICNPILAEIHFQTAKV